MLAIRDWVFQFVTQRRTFGAAETIKPILRHASGQTC
jgi:hypothetical protein